MTGKLIERQYDVWPHDDPNASHSGEGWSRADCSLCEWESYPAAEETVVEDVERHIEREHPNRQDWLE